MSNEVLLTIDEVAERLKISRPTATRWLENSGVPTVRVGKRLNAVRESDLPRLADSALEKAQKRVDELNEQLQKAQARVDTLLSKSGDMPGEDEDDEDDDGYRPL